MDFDPSASTAAGPAKVPSARRGSGLLLMLGAVACFTAMVTAVKLLREAGMSTVEVMVWRMGPGLPWVLIELRLRGVSLRPRRPGVVAARSIFGALAMGMYFFAVRSLSLFQNAVVHLSQPVFVSVLSPPLLRERLRGTAVLALPIALAGAVTVILPDQAFTAGLAAAGLAAAVPLFPGALRLLSAVFSALAHMMVRRATSAGSDPRPTEAPETVVLYFTATVTTLGLLIGLALGDFRSLPAALTFGQTALLIAGMAGTGLVGQLLLSRAYARTQAPAVAMVAYAGIPLSMLADALVWGTAVELSGYAGAGLMVVAGVLLVRGENKAAAGPG